MADPAASASSFQLRQRRSRELTFLAQRCYLCSLSREGCYVHYSQRGSQLPCGSNLRKTARAPGFVERWIVERTFYGSRLKAGLSLSGALWVCETYVSDSQKMRALSCALILGLRNLGFAFPER